MPAQNCSSFYGKVCWETFLFLHLSFFSDMCSIWWHNYESRNASVAPPLTFSSPCRLTSWWQSVSRAASTMKRFRSHDFPTVSPHGLFHISHSYSSLLPRKLFHALHSHFTLLVKQSRRHCHFQAVLLRDGVWYKSCFTEAMETTWGVL